MDNGSLMKVESIAECSPSSILQYFWPALIDNWFKKQFLVFFLSGRLRQVLLYIYFLYVFQSLLNQRSDTHSPQYLGSIIPAYIVMLVMAVIAFFMAGGSTANIKASLSCRRTSSYIVD